MADSANLKLLLSPKAMAGGFATTRTDSAQFSIKPRLTKEASSSVQKRRQLFIRTHNEMLSVVAMSAIQIVRPAESRAETQPQLHPALLRLSAMISQYFSRHFSEIKRLRERVHSAVVLMSNRCTIAR
jgi:hypothetical protein